MCKINANQHTKTAGMQNVQHNDDEWERDVTGIGANMNAYNGLAGKSERKRPLGRSECS
jgi:hypothetical protein